MNRAIRATKLLALEYADGLGIGCVSPFQANREGFKEAEKSGGEYTLRALAGANESERSADYVYSLFLNDTLRNACELMMAT